jgi:hypothetical protein
MTRQIVGKAVSTGILLGIMTLGGMLVSPHRVTAQAVGGGVSVFVPADMFLGNTGSISFETSLETALGLGDYFSIPVGVAYNQVYGSGVTGSLSGGDDLETSGPWFYSDSLLPYLLAQVHLPLGPLYLDLFGGGALNWNASLRPFHDRIARDLRDAGVFGAPHSGPVAVTDLSITSGIGYGWVAGASAGVQIGQISVGVTAAYRHILHDLAISGRYFRPDDPGDEFDSSDDDFPVEDLQLLLHGVSIGINGSFRM